MEGRMTEFIHLMNKDETIEDRKAGIKQNKKETKKYSANGMNYSNNTQKYITHT